MTRAPRALTLSLALSLAPSLARAAVPEEDPDPDRSEARPAPAEAPTTTTTAAPAVDPKTARRAQTLYGLGIFGVSFGILNIGYGVPLAILCPGDACFSGYIGIGFGVAFIAVGAPMLHWGRQHRVRGLRRRRELERAHQADLVARYGPEPPSGTGLLVGGSLSIAAGFGFLAFPITASQRGEPDGTPIPTPTWAKVGLGFDLAAIAGGAVMLGFGAKLAHRHRRWSRGGLSLLPMPWMPPGGFGFGLAGRF